MKTIKSAIILGATSAIAKACAHQLAATGCSLLLVGRSEDRLQTMAKDLQLRYRIACDFFVMDINDKDKHQDCIEFAKQQLKTIDVALIAHGTLPKQLECEQSVTQTIEALDTNATSTIAFLTVLANCFEQQRHGCIAVISSVASDRGKKSNYIYAAAKAAVTCFLQGLQQRLSSKNVNVLIIKPGFVDTPMTADFKKGLIWAQPEKVAKDILKAIAKKRYVLYTPHFWKYIMLVIKMVPSRVFSKLDM